jgi:carbamoyl-phosphate synthase small subunit
LEDGTVFTGLGFGQPGLTVGEVVFNTGMVGYHEAMTDPSYAAQILCFTYPLLGNYGVPAMAHTDGHGIPLYFESRRIQVAGVIAHEVCFEPSHHLNELTIDEWMRRGETPGIYGIDTRRLTTILRERGVMMGALEVGEAPNLDRLRVELAQAEDYGSLDLAAKVSVKEPVTYPNPEGRRVVLIDCGVKFNIIRELLRRGFEVVQVPYDTPLETVYRYEPEGVVLSNGPGDPARYEDTIETIRGLIRDRLPILGICLGNQLLALALGGRTFKLKYGHRGQNKPCVDLTTGLSYVTSQNHGYAVDAGRLKGTGLKAWFMNADDETVEGLIHQEGPFLAVQFHPEATPGPYDTTFVFDRFTKLVQGV